MYGLSTAHAGGSRAISLPISAWMIRDILQEYRIQIFPRKHGFRVFMINSWDMVNTIHDYERLKTVWQLGGIFYEILCH